VLDRRIVYFGWTVNSVAAASIVADTSQFSLSSVLVSFLWKEFYSDYLHDNLTEALKLFFFFGKKYLFLVKKRGIAGVYMRKGSNLIEKVHIFFIFFLFFKKRFCQAKTFFHKFKKVSYL
jgi:hypothetical protein